MVSTWNRRLGKLSEARKAGKTVWWARPGFNSPDYRHIDPKFHKFKDRREVSDDKFSRWWVAECGYSFKFNEYLMEEHPRTVTTAPKVADRCRKCNR